ncbi:MAG: energy transducer TonB [Vicinamibacteria bacterium]
MRAVGDGKEETMAEFRFATLASVREGSGVGERRSITLPLSLGVHAALIAGLVGVGLVRNDPLPDPSSSAVHAFFVEPAAAPPPPPPPPKAAPAAVRPQPVTKASQVFTAPVDVPDRVQLDAGGDVGVAEGSPDGVPGGVPGGVVGGIVGGLPEAPAPPSPTIVRIGGDIREPRKLKQVNPEYPLIARATHIEGVVLLECLIDADGRVKDVRVLRAHPFLADAAVEAVRQWVYTPTLVNGVPSQALMTVTVRFELRSENPRIG